MPTYTYQVINEDGSDGEVFEVIRRMSDPPLTEHPDTGAAVKRIFQVPHLAGPGNLNHNKSRLSDKNLAANGFTKYQRNGKGHYERTVGNFGPESISSD